MNELFNVPKWQEYGYYSKEAFNHYINRQQKVFLGHLKALKTWHDYYGLKQRLYSRDTQKHKSLFHPWRKINAYGNETAKIILSPIFWGFFLL